MVPWSLIHTAHLLPIVMTSSEDILSKMDNSMSVRAAMSMQKAVRCELTVICVAKVAQGFCGGAVGHRALMDAPVSPNVAGTLYANPTYL